MNQPTSHRNTGRGSPSRAVAQVRQAVRNFLRARIAVGDLAVGDLVLVACSGGPDSMALASQAAFVAPRLGLRVGVVAVDHQLQPGSAGVFDRARVHWERWGMDVIEVVESPPQVGDTGGWESRARSQRQRAFTTALESTNARAVLLGHTLDDQAETVLIQAARGSGARSLAGMQAWVEPLGRPLLDVRRSTTAQVCDDLALDVYHDPTNRPEGPWRDAGGVPPLRAAVRHLVLPVAREHLGAGLELGLARTAVLSGDDADFLDAQTREIRDRLRTDAADSVPVSELEPLHPAILRRLLRLLLIEAGAQAPTFTQVQAVMELVSDWHGQGPVMVSGGVSVGREYGRLVLVPNQ